MFFLRFGDMTKLSFTFEPTLCTAQRNTSSPANHPSPTDDFQEISKSVNTSSRPHTVITDVHREELHRGVNAFYPPTQFMPFVLVVRATQHILLLISSTWNWKTPLCPLRNWTERANVSVEKLNWTCQCVRWELEAGFTTIFPLHSTYIDSDC